jgi:threonine/homoserine/homoserine lactone efflux protein
VTLTVYGHWPQAFSLNPAGPLAVVFLLLAAAGLLWIAKAPEKRGALLAGSLWYVGAAVLFWLAWWIRQISN